MFVVRKAQLELLGRQSRVLFEEKLVQHFLNVYPRECRQAGGVEQIRVVLVDAVDESLRLGFTSESATGLFVAVRFILGTGVARDPQIPWAGEILENRKIANDDLRIRMLYDRMLRYLEETAGRDCEHVVRAMIRLRGWDMATAPTVGTSWPGAMLELLGRLYPQKAGFQGGNANRRLVADGLAKARRYGVDSDSGAALYVILMFMLGSEFDGDGLHPWAARVLGNRDLSNQADRVAALYQASRTHMEESFSPN